MNLPRVHMPLLACLDLDLSLKVKSQQISKNDLSYHSLMKSLSSAEYSPLSGNSGSFASKIA